jgi:hypothetical protein
MNKQHNENIIHKTYAYITSFFSSFSSGFKMMIMEMGLIQQKMMEKIVGKGQMIGMKMKKRSR